MDKMLNDRIKQKLAAEKAEEIKTELRQQILLEDMGKKPMEIMSDSLDKFAQVKEFEDLADTLGEMMANQDEKKQQAKKQM